MARFDVHELKEESGLVVDCQANILSVLDTRLVVPLMPPEEAPCSADRLNPHFDLRGRSYVLVTQYAAAVEVRELGPVVGTLAEHDITICNAFDMLLTGY